MDDTKSYTGRPQLVVANVPNYATVKKYKSDDRVSCLLCGKQNKISDMRNHVGGHVLKSMRNVHDTSLKGVVEINICGWCGLSRCMTQMIDKRILSDCQYHYAGMDYNKARTVSKTTPCTNVPVYCPVCPLSGSGTKRTIWKYNALEHFATEHPLIASIDLPKDYPAFIADTFITREEESLMGIPEFFTYEWRAEHGVPNSDGIDHCETDETISKRQRGMSDTSTITSSYKPPSKKTQTARPLT